MKMVKTADRGTAHFALSRVAGAVLLALALLIWAAGCGSGGELTVDDMKIGASELGPGWELEGEIEVDPALEEKGSGIYRLGEMGAEKVLNQVFTRDSERLQVNLVQMGDAGMIPDVLSLLLEGGGGSNIYGSRDNIVAEIIGDNEESKEKAAQLLEIEVESDGAGEDAGEGRVRVSFELACVDDLDYMEFNELSNYLQGYTDGQPVDEGMKAVISATSFGDSVSMLTSSGSRVSAIYNFEPGVVEQVTNGVTTYTFDSASLPGKAGVPYVRVSGELNVGETSLEKGDGSTLGPEQETTYTAATSFWPASDDGVREIAGLAVGDATTDLEKVQALWRWVRYNINYSGPMGTRYGTLQVLSQGYGRCWDSSDVLVTLCRASGIPARQVAGWLADQDTGHVWSQAYLEGKGWVDVDCTSDHVGADTEYLPFFATDDGDMPILYMKMPSIEEI